MLVGAALCAADGAPTTCQGCVARRMRCTKHLRRELWWQSPSNNDQSQWLPVAIRASPCFPVSPLSPWWNFSVGSVSSASSSASAAYFGTIVVSFFRAPGATVLDGSGDSTI